MTLNDLVKMISETGINENNVQLIDDGGWDVDLRYEIMPDDFIKYAELDLNTHSTQGLINALSNAKRAIDCRTDLILDYLGINLRLVKKDKYEILNYIGIVAPRIINKIRKARNLLEHEYVKPDKTIVEDAIDVAILFEAAAKNIFKLFPEVVYVGNQEKGDSKNYDIFNTYISIIYKNNTFRLISVANDVKKEEGKCTIEDTELYMMLLKIYIAAKNQSNETESVNELFDKLKSIDR